MKKIKLTLEDIFNIPTAVIYNPDSFKPVSAVSIDSRKIKRNSLFVAVEGDNFDGHDFVKDAVKNGATAVIISDKNKNKFNNLEIPFITVRDTTNALGDLAKAWRNKLNAKIIGITGSSGKTSTKEMLAVILNEKYKVNKTVSNNNNHIGVPLTILDTNEKHEILIAELGTNHFGEIEYTAGIVRPDYALITNIGDTHLEFLKNKKGVLKEKSALFQSTVNKKGFLFINNDDSLLKNTFIDYPKRITYGFNQNSSVEGKITGYDDSGKSNVEIKYKNKKLNVTFPLYGEQNALNFLAASAVCFKLGLNKADFVNALKKLKPVDKRLNIKNYKKFVLIDDTYNANPDSMRYAIELVGRVKTYERKILILGDMYELGNNAVKYHEKLAGFIKKNKINEVFTTGRLMKNLDIKLQNSRILSKHFRMRKSLISYLQKMDKDNSVILVKGSRGMKMEEFVKILESGAKS